MALSTYDRNEISPGLVRHTLTEDGWSRFDFGNRRVEVPRDDLDKVREAREFASAIAAQAAMWERDLTALEAELVAAAQTVDVFTEDEPELDAKLAKHAELVEAARDDEGGDL